jgi:hypothetical protein
MLQQEYYNVHEGQSLFDIAVLLYGDAFNALQLAYINDIEITRTLYAGQKIKAFSGAVNTKVLKVYNQSGIVPATGVIDIEDFGALVPGAEYIQLGSDLQVMLQQDCFISHEGQNLFDVAVMMYGDSFYALQLAYENDLSMTMLLPAGKKIKKIGAKENAYVMQVYKQTKVIPATGTEQELTILLPGGIGYMQIQNDFKVS